jgi:hypothetical protein
VPGNVENELNEKPSIFARSIMHFLVPPALFPLHPDKPSKYARLARLLLYLRSHWIRMPLHLLLPHLTYKCYLMVVPGKTVAKELGK